MQFFFISVLIPSLAKLVTSKTYINKEWDGSIASSFNSGSGTFDSPYIISNASEFAYFKESLKKDDYDNKYVKITNDIILNAGLFKVDENLKYIKDDVIYYLDSNTNKYYNDSSFVNYVGSINEFEMLNSSLEFVDKQTRVQRNLRSILPDEEITKEEKVEEPSIEPRGFMVPEDQAIEPSPILNEEVSENIVLPEDTTEQVGNLKEEIASIPTISDEELKPKTTSNEKLRVVEIIPINDTVTEKEDDKDFMVNDFQDDDYVDFESAISEVGEN